MYSHSKTIAATNLLFSAAALEVGCRLVEQQEAQDNNNTSSLPLFATHCYAKVVFCILSSERAGNLQPQDGTQKNKRV